MNQRIEILNTVIDNMTMTETLDRIESVIEKDDQLHHVVVNAGKIVAMQDDLELRQSVNSCDLINADGQGVVYASRILGKPIKERVTGIDLMLNLIELAKQKHYKIFFFGAKEEVVSKVVSKYPKEIVAGYRNGYYSESEEEGIARQIAESGANILFVAISSPKKENFLYKFRDTLKEVNFIMGVGGSFDVVSGKTKRAPKWMQKVGLEWFYRFIQEPGRMWKRYMIGNTKFLFLVLNHRFKRSGS